MPLFFDVLGTSKSVYSVEQELEKKVPLHLRRIHHSEHFKKLIERYNYNKILHQKKFHGSDVIKVLGVNSND